MAHLFNNNNNESFQCGVGRSGTPEEVTSLGRQSCLPGKEQVRRKRPRPPLSFTVSSSTRSRSDPRRALRLSPREHRPRGTGRPFCACAARLAPPSAPRTPLPPNLKARLSGPTGPRRPMDSAGSQKRSPGARVAIAGLRPLPGCGLRTRLLLRGRPIPGSVRSPRREAEPQSRVPRGRGFTRGCMIIASLSSSSLLASVPAPFPLPPRSCPCSLQSGFGWMVGS